MNETGRLERRLGYRFRNPDLLECALTHRSVTGNQNNERLEFLGDAVLGMVVADFLYHGETNLSEGDLSRLRASLVNREQLASVAQSLEIGEAMRLGPGELKSGGFRRRSVLGDALEAIIGAVYLDGGIDAARRLITEVLGDLLNDLPDPGELKDPKTRLQELMQDRGLGLPEYVTLDISGPPHQRRFHVACRVPSLDIESQALGKSRRSAEQGAAEKALEELQNAG